MTLRGIPSNGIVKLFAEPPISEWWKFVRTSGFDEDWADLGLGDEDLARLEVAIVNDPAAGDVIAGTGGLRKLRFARDGAGKSGRLSRNRSKCGR